MKFTKRFTAWLLVMTLVFSLQVATVSADDTQENELNTQTDEVMPDLSNLEMLQAPDRDITVSPAAASAPIGNSLNGPQGINDKSDLPEVPEDAASLPFATKGAPVSYSLTINPTIGVEQQFYDLDKNNGTKITSVVAATSDHCIVYVDKNAPKKADFMPSGTTPSAAAAAITAEFESIYTMMKNNFGEPTYLAGTEQKVKILLYDIDGDGDGSANMYAAGYFYSGDFFENDPGEDFYSNEDTILYIDIGTRHGYAVFADTDQRPYFYGTIVHELQHLINFSKLMYINGTTGIYGYPNDPDASPLVSTWLNEGLSGLADAMYLKTKGLQMNQAHLDLFLKNYINTGYVPTRPQWSAQNSNTTILANYGASSVLMQEYLQYKTTTGVKPVLEYPVTGYYGSLQNAGGNFADMSMWDFANLAAVYPIFNNFFTLAMLDVAVDTPDSSVTNIKNAGYVAYATNIMPNMWDYRTFNENNKPADYKTPVATLGTSQSINSGNRNYYSQLFLANSVGASRNTVTFTLPASPKASYYIITPFNATNIDTRAEWDAVPKIAAKIANNTAITVGTNNMFAVVAINCNTAVNETLKYATSAIMANPVITTQPTALTEVRLDNSGATVALSVTANSPDGGTLSYQWYKNTKNTNTGGTVISGATADTYNAPRSAAGVFYYYVVVKNNNVTTKASNVAVVKVSGLNKLTIATPATKLVYNVGETLDLTGLVVNAVYSDGVTPTTDAGILYTANPANTTQLTTAGKQTVELSFTDNGVTKTTSFTVTVKGLESIKVKTMPTKTAYEIGEDFETAGLVVDAVYYDGTARTTVQNVTPVSVTPADGTTFMDSGKKTITVSYTDPTSSVTKDTTFTVTVKGLDRIVIKSKPNKTIYNVGDTLDLSGLMVNATYSDGVSETTLALSAADYTVSPIDGAALNAKGVIPVTVSYTDSQFQTKTTSFDVSVRGLTNLGVVYPDKMEYKVGESLDLDGLEVYANYSDGTNWDSVLLTAADYTVTPAGGATLTTLGNQWVVVSYTDAAGATKGASFYVKVVGLTGIYVASPPDIFNYLEGEPLDLSGLTVYAKYSDGSEKDVTASCTIDDSNVDTSAAGDYAIDIEYAEGAVTKTTEFPIFVYATVPFTGDVVGIWIASLPDTTLYFTGEELYLGGLEVVELYSDNSMAHTDNYTTSPADGDVLTVAGDQTVTVTDSASGFTAGFGIVVNPAYKATFVLHDGGEAIEYYAQGADIVIPSYWSEGYVSTSWSDGADDYEPGDLYELTSNTRFTAQWNQVQTEHSITVTASKGGNASANMATAWSGDTVTLTAAANADYKFKSWDVLSGGVTIKSDNTFIMPDKNVKINAIFESTATPPPSGGGGGGGGFSSPAPATNVIVNDVPTKGTLQSGVLVYTLTKADVEKYLKDGNLLSVEFAKQNNVRLNVPISALGDSALEVVTDFGSAKLSSAVLKVLAEDGDDLSVSLAKGSLVIGIKVGGEDADYNDPANPIVITLPANVSYGQNQNAFVAVNDATNAILPFSIYGNGFVKAQVPSAGTYDVFYNYKSFSDTASHWASNDITFVTARGLFSGVGDGQFNPNGNMTRAMFAVVLAKLDGADLSKYTTSRFSDVAVGEWYAAAIEWAADNNIIGGIGDGQFAPNTNINREQMAVMLNNYINYKGYTLEAVTAKASFSDSAAISSWAADAIENMQAAGLIGGKPNNLYDPKGLATRGEVAKLFFKFVEACSR